MNKMATEGVYIVPLAPNDSFGLKRLRDFTSGKLRQNEDIFCRQMEKIQNKTSKLKGLLLFPWPSKDVMGHY